MRITRRFTTAGQSPFKGVQFSTIDIDRPHSNPAESCCVTDFEVPAHWSEQASEILVTRYARHSSVPVATVRVKEENVPTWLQPSIPDKVVLESLQEMDRFTGEQSVLQIISRMVGSWTYAAWVQDYFDTEEDARAFYDEWCYMLIHQMAAPSSPQWMNAGLNWAYGIRGSAQGHWHYDHSANEIVASEDSFSHPQLHACFIQGVGDELVAEGGILDLWTREARAFKYGATTGSNVSALRASGERLSNGEVSPGLINFLSVGDRNAGAIQARSCDKRTSKLTVVDIDHPDVPVYLKWKMEEETKAAAMLCGMQHIVKHVQRVLQVIEQAEGDCEDPCDVSQNTKLAHVVRQARRNCVPESVIAHTMQRAAQGFTEIELPAIGLVGSGSVLRDVSAHHAKLAVRLTSSFVDAARQEGLWEVSGRADSTLSRMLCAGTMLSDLSEAIWANEGPSVQFTEVIDRFHTCPNSGRITASNPNHESFFLDDTATPLASINILGFARDGLDHNALLHAVQLVTLQLDITVDMSQYPSKRMAEESLAHRPLGLSLCNLSGYLMQEGIAYDSEEGRHLLGALTGLVTGAAYRISVELAKELGSFASYSNNRNVMQKTLQAQAEHVLSLEHADSLLLQLAEREWSLALVHGERHGYRNAQTTLLAEMPMVMKLLEHATPAAEPTAQLLCDVSESNGKRVCHDLLVRGLKKLGYEKTELNAVQMHVCGAGSLDGAPHINHDSLEEKGFTHEQLALLEEALPTAQHISEAFDPWVLGEHFCREQLGISDDALFDAAFDMLTYLGFSAQDIEHANHYACGHGTVAGAQALKTEDAAVFACKASNENADNILNPEAHIAMLSTLTPCVSGGIFHRVTVTNDTTISAVRSLVLAADTAGLKALHIDRLHSGLHLQSQFDEAQEEVLEEATPRLVSLRKLHGPYRPSLEALKEAKA